MRKKKKKKTRSRLVTKQTFSFTKFLVPKDRSLQSKLNAATGGFGSVQFSPSPIGLESSIRGGGGEGNMSYESAEILFKSFSAGGPCEQFWHGQGRPFFEMLSIQHLLC